MRWCQRGAASIVVSGTLLCGVGCAGAAHHATRSPDGPAYGVRWAMGQRVAISADGSTAPTRLRVASEEMAPTLRLGQRVDVVAVNHHTWRPAIGDVVVFHPPERFEDARCRRRPEPLTMCNDVGRAPSGEMRLGRIVATAGDELAVVRGRALVNGHLIDKWRTIGCLTGEAMCDLPHAVVVPGGAYDIIDDDRGASLDSRAFGPVRDGWTVGVVQVP